MSRPALAGRRSAGRTWDATNVMDYDSVAEHFDRRYRTYDYSGLQRAVESFLGDGPLNAVLEVGCGTGHWLEAIAGRARTIVGVDPFERMLSRARLAAPNARLLRARAPNLPFRGLSFERVLCINALHHFPDREQFFDEARRLVRRGGGLMTVGLDPHANPYGRQLDEWWVYDFFEGTREFDLSRFAPTRIIRGEITKAGFAWSETQEVEHIERLTPAAAALENGLVDRRFTSQLHELPEDVYARGVERIRSAARAGEGAGDMPSLVTDLRLYATFAWV